MTWVYQGNEITEEVVDSYYGFIYIITNTVTGRKYIGRKYFSKAGYKQVKGKRKKIRKVSDWAEYYGSSPQLLKDVEELGKDKFTREILRLCKSRGECNYYEAKYIIDHEAVLREDYYNAWLQVKVSSSHVKNLLVEGII